MSFNHAYNSAVQRAFRAHNKLSFYAWCYGSWTANLHYEDFKSMYLMGGEL